MDVVSAGSLIIAFVALVMSIWNTSKKDSKEHTQQITMVMAKLDSISEDIKDLKKDVSDMRVSIQDNHDRIIKLEMSLSTAWKRIDELMNAKEVRHDQM